MPFPGFLAPVFTFGIKKVLQRQNRVGGGWRINNDGKGWKGGKKKKREDEGEVIDL